MRLGLALAVAVGAALAVYGYAFELGTENQPLQIPAIERRVEPALFPGDPLVATLDRYPSIFFPVAAAMRRLGPLEIPYFLVHLATIAGAAAGIGGIARLLGAGRGGALLAALLLLLSPLVRPALGSRDTVVAHWVTPTTVSFPILLAAIYLLLKGRSGWAGIVLGIGTLVNAVTGGLGFLVALIATLTEPGRMRRSLRLGLGFGLVALPIVLRLPHGSLAEPSGPEFMTLLAGYYPYHFFPSAQPPRIFLRLALLLAAGGIAWSALPTTDAARRGLRIGLAVAILWAAGALFAEVVPIASVTKLHLLRADRWFYVLLFAALGVVAAGNARPRGATPEFGLGAVAMAIGALRGLDPILAWGTIVAALGSRAWPALVRLPLAALATLFALFVLDLTRFWGSALALAGLAAALLLPRLPLLRGWPGRAAACALVLAEVLAGAPTVGADGWAFARPAFAPEWREIQDWAARATPIGARFLTPPAIPGFRVYARRGTVVEHKDGAAMLWTPGFGPAWQERLALVEGALAARDTTRLWAVARHYGADYAVVERDLSPPGTIPVHSNARFHVLAASDAARAAAAAARSPAP